MFRFEKLIIWKLSVEYGKKVCRVAESLPKSEEFGLKSQLKRAALSISSNIAEGSGSSSKKDFSNFLDIAIKSTIETVSQLLFAREMEYVDDIIVDELYIESEILVRKIYDFKYSLKKQPATRNLQSAISEVVYE